MGGEVYGGPLFQQPHGEWLEALYNSNPTYTFRGTISKMLGRDDLQFGAYLMRRRRTN